MARKMSATERAARDVLNKYVRDGLMDRGTVNRVIRDGLHIAETTVRREYVEKGWGSALYYGGRSRRPGRSSTPPRAWSPAG